MKDLKIYKKAVEKWGETSQILMAIEEMSELTTELCHYLRDQDNFHEIDEEMADVRIMLDQLTKVIFNNEKRVKLIKLGKLQRLMEKLR